MRTVFISYSSKDRDFAERLAADLKDSGAGVWFDQWEIKVGDSITQKINDGIHDNDYLAVVLSPDSVASPWVKKELNAAMMKELNRRSVFVLPILHRDCEIPSLIADKRYADFRESYEFGFSEILRVLTPKEEGARPRPHLPVHPAVLERVRPFDPEMVLIPAGEFFMGSDPNVDKGARESEQPQHTLHLPDYYLARTPVTNAQYAVFVQATDHKQPEHWGGGKPPSGKEDPPVVNVSWHDAVAYCDWLAGVTGKPYHLPSEAEWEKGARGTDGRIYPWGNEWDAKRCNTREGGKGDTTPVWAYPQGASPYGLLDIAGNVFEWTLSKWGRMFEHPDYGYPYDLTDGRDELDGPDRRVLRGGAWYYKHTYMRCAYRNKSNPDFRPDRYGFRVTLDTP